MKIEYLKSFYQRAMDYDLSYLMIGLVIYIFTSNAFSNDKHTESYSHLINVIFWAFMWFKLSRDRIKGSDELQKRIELEIASKTYSTVMPILFFVGYGLLKFAKLHYEAQIIGLIFTIFLTVQLIVRIIVNKKYS